MTIITDATALILLAKASVLETFVNRNDVVTSAVVYEEVTRGKDKGRIDSIMVEKLVQEQKIKIKVPAEPTRSMIEKTFNLHKGELEVITLALKTNHTVLSDDRKCLNAAKALEIGFITSLDVVAALFKNRAITKEKALGSLDKLEAHGWYLKDLIRPYKEAVK